MALKQITPQLYTAVELSIAKWHLRVDHDDDDDLIQRYLAAAERHAETFTGRVFVDQTFDLVLDSFPADEIVIPNPPLIEVLSVKYGYATSEQTMDPAGYAVDGSREPAWLVAAGGWPVGVSGGVRVRFRAGYIDNQPDPPVGELPKDIESAILINLTTLYDNRQNVVIDQTVTALPWGWEQLLRPHRIWTAMA